MTEAIRSVFTNKETLFRELLVPAGLLAEILIAAVPARNSFKGERPSRERFAYDLFHTLNLASCYAINPENQELGLLHAALTGFIDTLAAGLRQKSRTVTAIAKANHAANFAGLLTEAQLSTLANSLQEHLAAIQMAIEYDPGKAQAWREAQIRISTPLTRNGRINRWRTLVRNSEWARCMGIVGFAPAHTGVNPFSSRVGIEKAPELWRDTFSHIARHAYSEPAAPVKASAVSVEPAPEIAVPANAVAASASETFRLPAGVTVNSTADGRLCVQGSFDPTDFLTSKQLLEIKKGPGTASEELRSVLAVRKFEQLCEFPALAETLETVRQWRGTQDASRAAVQHAFGQWRITELRKGVQAKLKTHFNIEERRILVTLLTEEKLPTAPASPAAAS